MAYWLMKSEPDAFSFEELKALGAKGSEWTGVRNYQARNNMRAMKIGEKILYYHSNIGLEVVGLAEVIGLAHPDSTTDDVRWECVDIRAVADMPKPVSRDACKANPALKDMVLVVNTRLSVQPVSEAEWVEVCRMGGLVPAPK
jgi:predicted RNA-binding protein with PUA-like domain